MAIVVKAGDTAPTVRAILLDATGEPVDINGSDVRFVMSSSATPRVVKIDQVATVRQITNGVDGTRGAVEYRWKPGDTDEIGDFVCEFEVTFLDGTVQTFPTEDYIPARVVDDLGGTV